MTAREKSLLASVDHEWTAEEEIQLFYAMGGLKPVGVNRHFYIACITDRLSRSLNRDYTTESIWVHLRTMYNLDALEDLEPLPFPNEEKEFSLPEAEFSLLLSKKRAASEESRQSTDGPPSIIAVATDNTTKGRKDYKKNCVYLKLKKKNVFRQIFEFTNKNVISVWHNKLQGVG